MTLHRKLETAPLYKIRYSKIVVAVEVIILVLIAVSIVHLLEGSGLVLIGLLYVLLTIRFFLVDSISKKIPPGSVIEIRKTPECLIWYDHDLVTHYSIAEIKIFITRWFILLQLGRGKSRTSKLLLVDSFADISHYTCFRRQLIEMNLC